MTTQIKPSEHRIDATGSQCAFLTNYARAHAKYHDALVSLKSSVDRELEGGVVWGLNANAAADAQRAFGALSALDDVKWDMLVTGDLRNSDDVTARMGKVNEWLKLAKEYNPHGANNHNWFFPVVK